MKKLLYIIFPVVLFTTVIYGHGQHVHQYIVVEAYKLLKYNLGFSIPDESNINEIKDYEIVSVVTKDCNLYEFELKGIKPKPMLIDSVLVGWEMGKHINGSYKLREVKIPISNIRTLFIVDTDLAMGVLTTTSILLIIFFGVPLLLSALKS